MKTEKLIAQVKKKRLAEGMSLRDVQFATGVAFSSLARYERGVGEPDLVNRARLEHWVAGGAPSDAPARPDKMRRNGWSSMAQRLSDLESRVHDLDGKSPSV